MLAQLGSILAPPLCWSCRAGVPRGSPLCGDCVRALRRLPAELVDLAGVPCFAPVAYEGAARALVKALKFHAALGVAGSMAAAIAATAPEGLFAGAALVPVPPTPERERRRGFDQAAVLAHALARRTGCTVVACLERADRGGSQVGRGRSERARALAGAVRVAPTAAPPPNAVLVDDVATTGATLAAAARALANARCRTVAAVVYARTPGR